MKRIVPLFFLIVIATAGIVMAIRLRTRHPVDKTPAFKETIPPAPDMDSIPGDSLYLGALLREREAVRQFFASDQSPLDDGDRTAFKGLNYYPPDLRYRMFLHLEPAARRDTVIILDTKGEERKYVRLGILPFTISDSPETLTVFREPSQNDLFLPFRDTTAGKETYEVGRYVEPVNTRGNTFLIDFNRAHNPYCAYSHRWACPIPPDENNLSVAIRAGEKKYHLD